MTAISLRVISLLITTLVFGVATWWLTASPLGLLGSVVTLMVIVRERELRALIIALSLLFCICTALSFVLVDGTRDLMLSLACLFAIAVCTGLLFTQWSFGVEARGADVTSKGSSVSDAPPSLRSIHPTDRPAAAHAIARAFWTGVPQLMHLRQRQPDGSYVLLETRLKPDYEAKVAIDDLDPKIRVDTASPESLDAVGAEAIKSAKIIENLFGNGWANGADGRVIYLPAFAQQTLGLTPDQINSSIDEGDVSWKQLLHPDEYEDVAAKWRRSLQTGELFSAEFHIRRATGVYAWARSAARPTYDSQGRITGWYGTSFDIDVYKKTEEALVARERQLEQLVGALPALIYCALPDGRPVYRSRKLREYLGFGLEDLDEPEKPRLQSTIDAIIHPDDLPTVRERYAHSLVTGEPYVMRHRMRRHDGIYRWVETRAEAMRDSDDKIVQWNGICLDIEDQVIANEELRLVQEELARASQAASLAELSASIAHEIGQPLSSIMSSSDVCDRWLSSTPPNVERARTAIKRVVSSAQSASDVVNRVRALFKHSHEARALVSLGRVLEEVVSVMSDDASRRRVQFRVEIEESLPPAYIDNVQIQQVLINLVRNGLEAMDTVDGPKVLTVRAASTPEVIQTEVVDCGPGVDPSSRIFEPFFSTKTRGMGMGLAICRTIVESHGGRLWVERNAPRGAKFIFTVPRMPDLQ